MFTAGLSTGLGGRAAIDKALQRLIVRELAPVWTQPARRALAEGSQPLGQV